MEIAGRSVPLTLDPGLHDPDLGAQIAIIEPAASLLGRLPGIEAKLRQQAAKEVAETVVEQQDETELPIDDFANSLELEHISVCGGAGLHYRSPEIFPGHMVTIYVNPDLSFDGTAVYRPKARS
jgi:hypothetical protein